MEPHQTRVVDEKNALDSNIKKLDAFVGSPAFGSLDQANRDLLIKQSAAMKVYSGILDQRIALF